MDACAIRSRLDSGRIAVEIRPNYSWNPTELQLQSAPRSGWTPNPPYCGRIAAGIRPNCGCDRAEFPPQSGRNSTAIRPKSDWNPIVRRRCQAPMCARRRYCAFPVFAHEYIYIYIYELICCVPPCAHPRAWLRGAPHVATLTNDCHMVAPLNRAHGRALRGVQQISALYIYI